MRLAVIVATLFGCMNARTLEWRASTHLMHVDTSKQMLQYIESGRVHGELTEATTSQFLADEPSFRIL